MSSALDAIRFLFCFGPSSSRTSGRSREPLMFIKSELKLPTRKGRCQILLKTIMIRNYFSECRCRRSVALSQKDAVQAPATTDLRDDGEAEEQGLQNGTGNSGNGEDSNGNGINGSGNGNGEYGSDEGREDSPEVLIGVEWWWWWKWQQARHQTQHYTNIFDVWPVDRAVQVVANGVIETIEPAVQAVVLAPIRQHVTMQGFIVLLVFGAFIMSCIQMFAGLAVLSTGVSLAGVTALTLALVWRPWWQSSSQRKRDNGDG